MLTKPCPQFLVCVSPSKARPFWSEASMKANNCRQACQPQAAEENEKSACQQSKTRAQGGRAIAPSHIQRHCLNDSVHSYEVCLSLVRHTDPAVRKRYLPEQSSPTTKERTTKIQKLLLKITEATSSTFLHSKGIERSTLAARTENTDQVEFISRRLLQSKRRARATYELYETLFPRKIWHCCLGTCFALNASSVEVVDMLAKICKTAKEVQDAVGVVGELVESRRRGAGGSNMAFHAPSRIAGEKEDGRVGTDRQKAMRRFDKYVETIMPFLYASPGVELSGVRLRRKLCTQAIHFFLGVSRKILFRRSKRIAPGAESSDPSKEVLASIIDLAGVRRRQHRRNGDRRGFPSIKDMNTYECGCVEPCFANVPDCRLERNYQRFLNISRQEKPRWTEHQFLLNIIFCPLSNSTVRQCDRAIEKLFTVSEGVVGAVRRTLHLMCNESLFEDQPLQPNWWNRGYLSANHPANRMDDDMRERIENHLNMILRPDPSGGEDKSVCSVYSTEVNTHEKLRKFLTGMLKSDNRGPGRLSSSSLQKRINEYLEAQNLRVSFRQTDHNACPHCKTFKHASFRYQKEYKLLKAKLDTLSQHNDGNCLQRDASKEAEIQALTVELQTKIKKMR